MLEASMLDRDGSRVLGVLVADELVVSGTSETG